MYLSFNTADIPTALFIDVTAVWPMLRTHVLEPEHAYTCVLSVIDLPSVKWKLYFLPIFLPGAKGK